MSTRDQELNEEPLKIRSSLLAALLIHVCTLFSVAQDDDRTWVIEGYVKDQDNIPIQFALVYISGCSNDAFLDYTNTDPSGYFRLTTQDSVECTIIESRFLGYEEFTTKLNFEKNIQLEIVLHVKTNQLQEIIISDKPPSIIEKSDTTIYNLSEFRDSTEYSIEDILRKLPGIEISHDGTIKAKGKSISTILVEGDDMFGGRYTIASKNIRADYISKIEVIDHYLDNPVMSGIKNSEAIVLNLILDDKKKNILSSAIHVGLGYGDELKAKSHINVFSINKKIKSIFLSNNGNTGDSYGIEDLQSNIFHIDYKDFKNKIFTSDYFTTTFQINNPGLPNIFIDNGKSYFNSISTNIKLNNGLNLSFQGINSLHNDDQTSNISESFILDRQVYELNNTNRISNKNGIINLNTELTYIGKNNKSSVNNYLVYEGMNSSANLDYTRFGTSINENITGQSDLKNKDIFFSSVYTQKLSKNSLHQLQLKTQHRTQPESSVLDNTDIVEVFNTTFLTPFLQEIHYHRHSTEVKSKFIKNIEKTDFDFSTNYQYSKSYSSQHFEQLNELNNQDTVTLNLTEFNLGLNHKINESLYISIFSKPMFYSFENQGVDIKKSDVIHSGGLILKLLPSSISKLNIGYEINQSPPSHDGFHNLKYIADNFTLVNSILRNTSEGEHKAYITYFNQNSIKFRSIAGGITYTFGRSNWSENLSFFNSVQISTPVFTNGNKSIGLYGYLKQFLPSIRTNIEFKPTYGIAQQKIVIQDDLVNLNNELKSLKLSVRTLLLPHFTIGLTTNYTMIDSYTSEGFGEKNTNTVSENHLEVLIYKNAWKFSANFFHLYSANTSNPSGTIIGVKLNISKAIKYKNKEITINLNGVNLLNNDSFDFIRKDQFTLSSNSVDAVPFFFLLSVDFSI